MSGLLQCCNEKLRLHFEERTCGKYVVENHMTEAGEGKSLECSATSRKHLPYDPGTDPHSRGQAAQPQEPRRRPAHGRTDGGDRAERLGQVEPRVRHAVRG